MIVGTAGHIDHGKTSLVKSLTGVDADRLKEEKERGITVDLGFAYTVLPDGTSLGFVDVPGHEKLVRNMLAGATGIDHVLLVVAADDGPMPQTLEHLAIIELLGLTSGAVVLTKCDAVSPGQRAQAQEVVRQLLMETALAQAPIFPVSNVSGEGIAELQAHLSQVARDHDARDDPRRQEHFRLAVDRSFSLPGVGTVVTGTAASGTVQVGDNLLLSPKGAPVRVRGVHAQNRQAASGHAGQRLALNLTGVDKQDVQRGDWVVNSAAHVSTQRIEGRLHVLPGEARPLAHWTPVHLHLGACDVGGRVVLLEGRSIEPGRDAWVQIELERPIGALRGDRFIVRDQSAKRTVGGGRVLDVFAPDTKRRKAQRVAWLAALDHDDPQVALAAVMALRLPQGIDLQRFAALWNLPSERIDALVASVPHRTLAEDKTTLLFDAGQLETYTQAMSDALRAHHARQPDSPGWTLEAWQRAVKDKPAATVFSMLVREMLRQGAVERSGAHLRLAGHEATLQGLEKQLWERIKPWLDEGGTNPPKLSDMLLRDRTLRKDQVLRVLQRLERMGKVHAVGAEYYIQTPHVLALARVAKQLAEHDANKRLNVKALREATGMSRHLSVPLVEFFDKIGYTKRDEVGRHIKRDPERMFGDGG